MSRIRRVRSVRPRSFGWDGRLLDEVQWPKWLYYPTRFVWRQARKHPRWATAVVVLLGLWAFGGAVFAGIVGVLALGCLTGWLVWRRGDEVAAGSGVISPLDLRRRAELRKLWQKACRNAKVLGPETGEPPKLTNMRPAVSGGTITAQVSSVDSGLSVTSLQKQAAPLADLMGLHELVVRPLGRGISEVTFHESDAIGEILPLAAMPLPPAGARTRAVYGVRRDRSPATVNYMQSLLTGGLTRKGKSNIIWALLCSLISQGKPVEIYVSDPKDGLELQDMERAMLEAQSETGEPVKRLLKVRMYAPDVASTQKMVIAAEKAMKARRYHMREEEGIRALEDVSEKYPLVIVLLDEIVVLQEMLRKGQDSPLGRIGFMGAATGYVIWANTQAATLDVLGRLRTFIPQRICVATDAPQTTDAVLGGYAESKGALCSELTVAGVGWSIEEGDKAPTKFRAALVTDAEARKIARGQLPVKVANTVRDAYFQREEETTAGKSRKDRRTGLYRHFYIDDSEYGNSVGYIGVGYDTLIREAQHAADLRRFMDGERRVTVEWFDTRAEALAAEELAIRTEKPIHNKQHNGNNPRRRIDKLRRRDKVA